MEKKICLSYFARKGLKLLAKWRILFIAESRPIQDGSFRTRGAPVQNMYLLRPVSWEDCILVVTYVTYVVTYVR